MNKKQVEDAVEFVLRAQTFLESFDGFIEATNMDNEYGMGFRNGLRFCKSCLDGEAPCYEEAKK